MVVEPDGPSKVVRMYNNANFFSGLLSPPKASPSTAPSSPFTASTSARKTVSHRALWGVPDTYEATRDRWGLS